MRAIKGNLDHSPKERFRDVERASFDGRNETSMGAIPRMADISQIGRTIHMLDARRDDCDYQNTEEGRLWRGD